MTNCLFKEKEGFHYSCKKELDVSVYVFYQIKAKFVIHLQHNQKEVTCFSLQIQKEIKQLHKWCERGNTSTLRSETMPAVYVRLRYFSSGAASCQGLHLDKQ